MNFLNRAIKSLFRKRLKNVLLFIIFVTLASIIMGANFVELAVINTETNLRNNMRPLLTFDMDTTSLVGEDGRIYNALPITAEMKREIIDLPHVRQHHYMGTVVVNTNQLISYVANGYRRESVFNRSLFTFLGTSNEIPLQFIEGGLDLKTGTFFESVHFEEFVYPVIISSEVAGLNNLSIGSLVDFEIEVLYPQDSELGIGEWIDDWHMRPENIYATEVFSLKVVGIFEMPVLRDNLTLEEEILLDRDRQFLSNTIFTTTSAVEKMQNFQTTNFVSVWEESLARIGSSVEEHFGRDLLDPEEHSFIGVVELFDARDIEDFKKIVNDILPDYWLVTDLSNTFSAITSSMDSLLEIAHWVNLSAIIVSILIISLINTLILHDRRKEIGIYLALGEKKIKVIYQIVIEVLIIGVVSMVIAIFIGIFISENISRVMLENQLSQPKDFNSLQIESSMLNRFGLNQEMSIDEMMASFELDLNVESVFIFVVGGIIILTISVIVPVFYIVKLEPKEIILND